MQEKNIDIWKRKLEWVAENGGMPLVNTHPDYMNFDGGIWQRSEVGGGRTKDEGRLTGEIEGEKIRS